MYLSIIGEKIAKGFKKTLFKKHQKVTTFLIMSIVST